MTKQDVPLDQISNNAVGTDEWKRQYFDLSRNLPFDSVLTSKKFPKNVRSYAERTKAAYPVWQKVFTLFTPAAVDGAQGRVKNEKMFKIVLPPMVQEYTSSSAWTYDNGYFMTYCCWDPMNVSPTGTFSSELSIQLEKRTWFMDAN